MPQQFYWHNEKSRIIGKLIHRYLYLISQQGLEKWSNESINRHKNHWHQELIREGFSDDDIAENIHLIETSLKNSLNDKRGCWILDNTHHDAQSEFALTHNDQQIIIVMGE